MKPRGQYRGPGYQPCFALHASTGFVRKKFWMPVWDWTPLRRVDPWTAPPQTGME